MEALTENSEPVTVSLNFDIVNHFCCRKYLNLVKVPHSLMFMPVRVIARQC